MKLVVEAPEKTLAIGLTFISAKEDGSLDISTGCMSSEQVSQSRIPDVLFGSVGTEKKETVEGEVVDD